MKVETIEVKAIFRLLLQKIGREDFIQQTQEIIVEQIGCLIESDLRNLAQWRSLHGPRIINKQPKLRRRKQNVERLQKLLKDASRSLEKLVTEIRKPETDPNR